MLIFARHNTPRLNFVLKFIFGDVFGTGFRITEDKREFRAYPGARIDYSGAGHEEGACRIPVSGLLSETGVREIDPGVRKIETGVSGSETRIREAHPELSGTASVPVLFHSETISPGPGSVYSGKTAAQVMPDVRGLDFDLFAAVFYMITRYEEYLPYEGDRYGRFPARGSLAARRGFLEIPVVDIWLENFRKELMNQFPDIRLQGPEFHFLPTCDIDLPFAYLHRGRLRTIAAGIKAGITGRGDGPLRSEVLRGKAKDPFDTYSGIEAIHAQYNLRPGIFFLTARYGRYDKSIPPGSSAFRDLVRRCMNFGDIGIHPSYRSSEDPSELRDEVNRLSGISGQEITRSRQHYLRFRLPGSYRNYQEAGIKEEYSMGFASAVGFRAGTARQFNFYDLVREEETPLRIIPFQVMDRTLKDYMKLTPDKALGRIVTLADAIRSTGGTFVSIWHNDAFSDQGEWKGWKDVYLQMMDAVSK